MVIVVVFITLLLSYNTPKYNSDEPSSYANQPYKEIFSLPGKLPDDFNSNTKGYQLSEELVTTTGNGYAYAYTKFANENVSSGDSLIASVWFYPNNGFNGDFIGLSYGGNSYSEKNYVQTKGFIYEDWQKLELRLKCQNGKAPLYFYFAIRGSDFENLAGSIIFAKPKYEIIKSGKGEQ